MSGFVWNEDPEALIRELADLAETVPADALSILTEGAKNVMEASKEMCPVDKGNLEAAHQMTTTRTGRDSMSIEISVGGSIGGVDVDQYAQIMHEFLQPFGAASYPLYTLGPKSQEKDASNPSGRRVGGKFLERAMEEFEPKIIKQLEDRLPGDK